MKPFRLDELEFKPTDLILRAVQSAASRRMVTGTTLPVAVLRDARKSALLRACESFDFCIFHMSQIKDLADPKMPKANRFTGSQDEAREFKLQAVRSDWFHDPLSMRLAARVDDLLDLAQGFHAGHHLGKALIGFALLLDGGDELAILDLDAVHGHVHFGEIDLVLLA